MARRVFFHIGAPKTGTTFLQTVMWHNKEELRAQGVLYPGAKRMDHFHATRQVQGVSVEHLGDDAGAWTTLVRELADWPDTGVITHEFFSRTSRRRARRAIRALAPAEVHVVLTARDYARQFPAVWQEALKMKSDLSFDEFMDKALASDLRGAWGWRTQDVVAVLRRWGRTLPPERIHVITVPRPGAPRDLLWKRWCEVLGLDPSRFDLDVAFENESVGAAQAALLHRVKPHLSELFDDGLQRHRWFRQYLGHEVLVPQQGERFGLRAHQWSQLREFSVSAVKAIEEEGYDVIGDLAELVPDAVPPERPHPDDVTDAEIVDVAARAIEQMVRDVRTATVERNEWKRRALAAAQSPAATRSGTARLARRLRRLGRRVRRRVRRTRAID